MNYFVSLENVKIIQVQVWLITHSFYVNSRKLFSVKKKDMVGVFTTFMFADCKKQSSKSVKQKKPT